MLIPRLDILPAAQRALWLELSATPRDFTLYGGTAIALRLGHRASADFDFFGRMGFDPDRLLCCPLSSTARTTGTFSTLASVKLIR